jgi:hypothetical protein
MAGKVTSKLLALPQGGYDNFPSQENDDHNPDRVKSRNLLDLGFGTDNLLHTEKREKITGIAGHYESHQQGGPLQLFVHLQRQAFLATEDLRRASGIELLNWALGAPPATTE